MLRIFPYTQIRVTCNYIYIYIYIYICMYSPFYCRHDIAVKPALIHSSECEWLPWWWSSTSQNMWESHYLTQSRYILCGTSRCVGGIRMDNNSQIRLVLCTGWFSATCFVLTRSYHQANKKRKYYCIRCIILFHIMYVWLGSPLHTNIIKLYDKPKRIV
jgi:hypothetical protein